ncbi:MAG: NAD(P)/FAD-dependent oxidoreductase [Desulfobacteraceae bacterium]|nr:MAG: NAD(P)/FAD-dependent oxidoreductase [Desulfobacteraceae bacterium]
MFSKRFTRRSFLTISAMTAAAVVLDWKKVEAWANNMGPGKNYPTVIIGAGLGGLCCGAYLARQGIPVTIVEQHRIPGGYATAFERGMGKFTFEVSLHGMSAKNNAVERILQNLGVLNQIEFAELPEIYSFKTPAYEIRVPQRDPETYIDRLAKLFPDEVDGIREFVNEMIAISDEADLIHHKNGKFFKLFFPFQYPSMWRVRNKTLEDMLNDHVQTPAVKDALAGLWGYYGLPPSQLSAFYYSVATGGYLKNGSYYIKPRSQALSNALARVVETNGGKIIYGKKAAQIHVDKNAVTSVSLEDATVLHAKAVVSNASAITTFGQMLAPGVLPENYVTKINSYKPSLSTFLVWLGLNVDIRDRVSCYATHMSSGSGSEADYLGCVNGDIEKGPFGVALYDKAFEGYSRPGTSSLMLIFLCGYGPWKKFENDYKAGNKDAYNLEKDRWTRILIRRSEETLIPGLSSLIDVVEAATPLTNQRYTANTSGAIYGFEQSMDNAYMTRINNQTPVDGLYLAGAWGNPGGGYEGVLRGGEVTFQMLMESWGG